MGASEMFGSAASYDRLMGRYGVELAPVLADRAGVVAGQRVLDIGCGTGALTVELIGRVGADHVVGIDPSPAQVDACRARLPDVRIDVGAAEALPYGDATYDRTLSQLVVHFFADAARAMAEMRRVTRPGGTIAAAGWDADDGMVFLREAHAAARESDPDAERANALAVSRTRREDLAEDFERAGLESVSVEAIDVVGRYDGPEDLVSGLQSGVGPIGKYVAGLPTAQQAAYRETVMRRLAVPDGPFELPARAWCALGRVPA